jgi:ubiquinone/menaquinone biosynthesis C-methylase UbiE
VSQIAFEEELAKKLEVMYHARDVLRRRAIVRQALGAQPGERVIDVGCGPGFYVAELLEEVGAQGSVLGVDLSEAMLAVAAKRCERHQNASFEQADATSLPAADESFDAALSVQVMEYVPDVGAALAEIHRSLRPGGRVVIWDVDWTTLSWYSTDPERMERAKQAFDKHLIHPALPRRLTALLRSAGFEDVAMEGHVFATNEIDPQAYICMGMPLLYEFIAAQDEFGPEQAKALEEEQRELGERGEFYAAVTQFCFAARRPS